MMKKILLFSALTIFLNSCTVEVRIDGCTDPCAANFDPLADDNDGTCQYYDGCTDPTALNYDPCAFYEPANACDYTCDVVYYLDYSAYLLMLTENTSYYTFYDYNFHEIGNLFGLDYQDFPPSCVPQTTTLTVTLAWSGNYDNNSANFVWSAYPEDGPIADYSGSFSVYPNECVQVELSFKKIQEYKEATK